MQLHRVRRHARLAMREIEEANAGHAHRDVGGLELVVTAYCESNSVRAFWMPEVKGLPAPTQAGSGISAIIVLPAASFSTRW